MWDMRNASKVVKTFDDLDDARGNDSRVLPNDDFFFTGVDAPMSRG